MPSFIKDKMSKKDEQKMQDMQSSMKAMDARIRALEAQNKDMAMMLEVYAKAIQQYNPNWHAHT